MVWRCADDRKTCSIVNALLKGKSLEWSESLIVVHREDCIIFLIVAKTEETVRRIWTESKDTLFVCSLNCRKNDLLLLIAKETAVAAVRIKAKYSNLRCIDAEISLERCLHKAKLLENLL